MQPGIVKSISVQNDYIRHKDSKALRVFRIFSSRLGVFVANCIHMAKFENTKFRHKDSKTLRDFKIVSSRLGVSVANSIHMAKY